MVDIITNAQAIAGYVFQLLLSLSTWVKYVALLLLVLNYKSFPGVWHWYVLRPAVNVRLGAIASIHPLLPWIPASKKVATNSPGTSANLKLEALPVGKDLFRVVSHKFHCSFADADHFMHMSNSNYIKITDYVRYTHIFSCFVASYYDGSWMALGGQSINHPREIPIFAKYETKFSIATWDSKWLYAIVKFVSPAKKTRGQAGSKKTAQVTDASLSGNESASKGLKTGVGLFAEEDLSSRTLYATAVSRFCFKAGRKTIPPWFIIATSGHGQNVESARKNWEQAESLRRTVHTQAQAKLKAKGKKMAMDLVVFPTYRKYGMLTQYDPTRPEGAGKSDERGLGVYQDMNSWDMSEWEERRAKGMEEVKALGAYFPLTQVSPRSES